MNPNDFRSILNGMDNVLAESIGLANRKSGQTFINNKGDVITFVAINFFPVTGKYDSQEDLEFSVQEIEKKYRINLTFVNAKRGDQRGFGIASFKDENGRLLLLGKYFKEISPIFTKNNWQNNEIPGGFRYNSKSSLKMTSGLMPQDILTNFNSLTPNGILKQVTASLGEEHPLTKLTKQITQGKKLPLTVDMSAYPDVSFEGFRDYFCELLQPIAIIKGLAEGNSQIAEKIFFGAGGFSSATITFDNGKNGGLFDSLLIDKKGKIIQISTKGKGGAKASISNLVNAVKDLKESGNTQLAEEHKDIIEIIQMVQKGGYMNGPLSLAKKFNMISSKEADIVAELKTDPNTRLTKNLQKMYDSRLAGAHDISKVVPFYNMLAAIAYKVADYVNNNTDFGNAAADILNHSALIQVNTSASQKGQLYILEKLVATFPSKAISDIKFSAHKTYFSTGNKGNFTFKINATTGDEENIDDTEPQTSADVDAETQSKVAKIAKGNVKIRPPGTERAKRVIAAPPRERRK